MTDNIPALDILPEVRATLDRGGPVVALESTIICHGMPWPDNVETARRVEQAVRDQGATPATIAIIDGRLKVGLAPAQLQMLGKDGAGIAKVSCRDIAFAVAARSHGATTVAATMRIAALAGVRVFATGGIGGVHRGAESTMDISADLIELASTDVAVVCAGAKSILDIGLTLEHLETHAVPVIGYRCDEFPAFYTRCSGHQLEHRLDHPADIAAVMHARWSMGIGGGLVIANPIAAAHALDQAEIDAVISDALADMAAAGVTGKATTPFLLRRIGERTGGRSLAANIELVVGNAQLAAAVACEFAGR